VSKRFQYDHDEGFIVDTEQDDVEGIGFGVELTYDEVVDRLNKQDTVSKTATEILNKFGVTAYGYYLGEENKHLVNDLEQALDAVENDDAL
jgi:iron uptake system EfeUOB component EfeO/EfeM